MKTSILKISALAGITLLLASGLSMSSCKKDKTCHGKVHVIDTPNGSAVANAAVKLSVTGGDVKYEGTTDGAGDCTFEVTLPAIFDVYAVRAGKEGTGVIRLDEPGKEDAVTVTIQ